MGLAREACNYFISEESCIRIYMGKQTETDEKEKRTLVLEPE